MLIEHKLNFTPGKIYHLQGENGSGKSSFIRHSLLPAINNKKDLCYRLYLQQLFHLQAYAIKSHSAFYKPELKLNGELDCLQYLLNNLSETYAQEPRPVYCLVDENRHLPLIFNYLNENKFPFCLIFCDHSSAFSAQMATEINFQVITPTLSKVYETTV